MKHSKVRLVDFPFNKNAQRIKHRPLAINVIDSLGKEQREHRSLLTFAYCNIGKYRFKYLFYKSKQVRKYFEVVEWNSKIHS